MATYEKQTIQQIRRLKKEKSCRQTLILVSLLTREWASCGRKVWNMSRTGFKLLCNHSTVERDESRLRPEKRIKKQTTNHAAAIYLRFTTALCESIMNRRDWFKNSSYV